MSIESLVESIRHCTCCNLHENGKEIPWIGEYAKNIIILDHPRRDMDENMEKFWKLFKEVGLSKQEFVVMHTVQCYTKITKRMGKPYSCMPSRSHREECKPFLHYCLYSLKPSKMLVMGNIAMEHVCGEFNGIVERNATVVKSRMCDMVVPCVLSVSPSFLNKHGEGYTMVKKSLEVFKHL